MQISLIVLWAVAMFSTVCCISVLPKLFPEKISSVYWTLCCILIALSVLGASYAIYVLEKF